MFCCNIFCYIRIVSHSSCNVNGYIVSLTAFYQIRSFILLLTDHVIFYGRIPPGNRQITKTVGVSAATVSRVLNRRTDLVKPDTLQQVLNVARELGYQLPESNTAVPYEQPVVILNIPSVNNIFYSQVIEGAVASSNAHGCHLIINQSSVDSGNIQNFLNLIRRVSAAGVILTGPVTSTLLEQLNHVVPVVQCCENNPDVHIPFVTIDDYNAARTAAEYLIDRGYHKLAFINGPASYKYSRDRKRGFMDALQAADISVPANWICHLPEVNYEMAYAAACQLLTSETRPDAFFAVSDTYAAAVIRAAKRYQLQVPKDIAVIGFDNTEISSVCTPSITTVSQPRFQLGYSACEILLEYIANPAIEPRFLLLETELIIRESA